MTTSEPTVNDLVADNQQAAPPQRPASPADRAKSWLSRIDFYSLWPILVMLAIIIYTSSRSANFLTVQNFSNIISSNAVLGIVTMGQTILLISAGIDLSVAANVSITGVVIGLLITQQHVTIFGVQLPHPSIWMAILVGLAFATLIGLVNGILVAQNRAHPFIITLGMAVFLTGLATEMTASAPVNDMGSLYTTLSGNLPSGPPFFGMPWATFLLIIMVAFTYCFLRWSPLGRRAYAIGGNEAAAFLSGIPIKRSKIYLYTLVGFIVGIAAVLQTGLLDSAVFNNGQGLELQSIACAVIGGTALFGGRGGALRGLQGLLLYGLVTNSLNFLNYGSNYQQMALGIIIVAAVMVQRVQR